MASASRRWGGSQRKVNKALQGSTRVPGVLQGSDGGARRPRHQNSIRMPADGTIGMRDSKRFDTRPVAVLTPGGLKRTLSRFIRLITSAKRVSRFRAQLNVRLARTSTRE